MPISEDKGKISLLSPSEITHLVSYHFQGKYLSALKAQITRYIFISLDSGAVLWLYVNPCIRAGRGNLPLQIALVGGSLWVNFVFTALAADSIFEHLRGFSKPIAVQRFTKQKRSLLTVLGYTIGITIGGIFSSIVPAAAAMTVGAGSKWMKAAEAFSVLAGNLPINMYGGFNLIHENGKSTHDFFERILCLSSGEGPLSLEKIDRQERANLLRLWFLSTLQKATHTIISEERIEDLEQFNGLSLLLYIAKQISVKEKSALEVESSKYKNNMRKAFGWFGAIFGELELTGYFMSTKCLMDAFFSPFGLSWVSTPIILAIPAYLSYLFGYKTFTTVWDMIGDLFHGK